MHMAHKNYLSNYYQKTVALNITFYRQNTDVFVKKQRLTSCKKVLNLVEIFLTKERLNLTEKLNLKMTTICQFSKLNFRYMANQKEKNTASLCSRSGIGYEKTVNCLKDVELKLRIGNIIMSYTKIICFLTTINCVLDNINNFLTIFYIVSTPSLICVYIKSLSTTTGCPMKPDS